MTTVTTMVSVTDAKAQLSRLLRQIDNGETIIITRYGRPVAVLRRHSERVPTT
jgi:prevent-host-death family protein